ncbi:IS607 family transposase [Acetohalobium arabaticum]|uniref:DNA binding domain protein, excisionase family n=1 Tax=Acetohalobium arabaticum (strain ATCC 49924 / DSM 5501 / Z-7288) TaxID=574087 RepID=D9QVP4_ACEAZ|nr:IS607 family transposase [Acetohalobium arabaticum]ADL12303.1 DNA binding domain protein, excisionase family [Acetohalobium arabaticum DSM 5501]
MKLSVKEAADFLGVAKSTLRRWDNEGKLVADRTEGGHRRYPKDKLIAFQKKDNNQSKLTIGYCRVSSHGQKDDLKRQVENVSNYCIANGYQFKIIRDIGSGLNYKKKGLKELIELIESRKIERIVVNYKDRLIRFGYEMFEQICELNNVEIEIINHTENKTYQEELVDDVLSIITVFSAKLYGSRSSKAKKIKETNKELFD